MLILAVSVLFLFLAAVMFSSCALMFTFLVEEFLISSGLASLLREIFLYATYQPSTWGNQREARELSSSPYHTQSVQSSMLDDIK